MFFSFQKVRKEAGDVISMVTNAGTRYPVNILSTNDEEIPKCLRSTSDDIFG